MTLAKHLEKKIDRAYTRMRLPPMDITQRYFTKGFLYDNLLSISYVFRERRIFVGHYWRSKDEISGILGKPKDG